MKLFAKVISLFNGKSEKISVTKEEIDEMQKTIDTMAWLVNQYQECLEAAEKTDNKDIVEMYRWAIKSTERRISEMERKVSAC